MRLVIGERLPVAVDLDVVLQLLNENVFSHGSRLLAPVPLNVTGFEGALVRNPDAHNEWGILYKPHPNRTERQRFTIAHEMGHFVLHRALQDDFRCDMAAVNTGQSDKRNIERDANAFASNLLMPRDVLRDFLGDQRKVTLHLLSEIAGRFKVSFEALCLRFIETTNQRAILLYWDNGFLKYQWASKTANWTKARVARTDEPLEPFADTLAADETVIQCFDGEIRPASLWCANEAPHMKLREFKHSYANQNRVLTLLLLESAEPRAWDDSWKDEYVHTASDQFRNSGQLPVR